VAYLLAAHAAFLIGTLSDKIFAPFWPPNAVLFYVFLIVPRRRWWVYVLATFPAHAWAELSVGMTAPALLVAFATNVLVAALSATGVRKFLRKPPWLGTLRKALLFILIAAVVSPVLVAFGGAFVQILGGGALAKYGAYWTNWYAANALGAVTLESVVVAWSGGGRFALPSLPLRQKIEAIALGVALVVSSAVAFDFASNLAAGGFQPAALYAPLPIILWITIRFGTKGASLAILLVTIVLIVRPLNGSNLFVAQDPETNVLAMQLFIVTLAIPTLLLGASVDQARNTERSLRDREEQITFAARNTNIGLWHLDLPGNKLWLSDHCRAMLGLPRDNEPSREALFSVVHPDDRATVARSMGSGAGGPDGMPHEFRGVMPNGEIKWFLARSQSEPNDGRATARISGFFADITTQKALAAEAEIKSKEITHLMRIATLSELSGAIAHELHQPLTAILSNAQAARQMLDQSPPNLEEIGAILEDIVLEDARAGEVIERARRLMKKVESRTETVDFNTLISATLGFLHSELIHRMTRTELELAAGLPLVVGDPIQLQQVLLNLIMNASEAMSGVAPGERVITITTQPTSTGIRLIVADRGPGLSAAEKKRVFEPFFTTKERGLGLGLPICSTIVASHGGMLSFADNPGGGAAAILCLPKRLDMLKGITA
jgi:signal transduction histidine kinase/integral membrane sensor domain MASE1